MQLNTIVIVQLISSLEDNTRLSYTIALLSG